MTSSDKIASVDVSGEQIRWDLSGEMTYGDYLQLDRLLDAQTPLTDEHDEPLFIIIHQTSELWIKLCLHELDGAIRHLRADRTRPAFKMLARIARVQEQLSQAWDVLATMTPSDYLRFRDRLGHSSGFQSYNYRILEFRIGNKNPALADVHRDRQEIHAQVLQALNNPSLYDESLRLLARRGFAIPDSHSERDWSQPYRPSAEVEEAWRRIYRAPEEHWELYELAEKLVDLEQKFQHWRFSHMKTVERIIGYRAGTGGTSGVAYLVKALELRFFPELWTLRTTL